MHTVDKFIRERKSVYPKFFTDETIEEGLLWQILESANWAPTHRMTEPWRFKVIRGQALKELGTYLAKAYKEQTPKESFSDRKYKEKKKKVMKAGAVIAIILNRDPQKRVPEWEELAALSAAVQNLWISASANGLGGYWSSPAAIIGRPEILKLPEGQNCYGLFYLGHFQMPDVPRERGDIRDKVEIIEKFR